MKTDQETPKIKSSLIAGVMICGIVAGLIYWFNQESPPSHTPQQVVSPQPQSKTIVYETLEKKDKNIKRYPSTSVELKNISLHKKPDDHASPTTLKRAGRFLRGDDLERFSDEKVYLPTVNTPNPNWKEKLGHELLRFQPEGVKVALAHEQSYLSISKGKGRYMELIVVNYINPVSGNTAFRALADSETGQLIDTWDQTHSERPVQIKFTQHQD
ncbi:MAG: hypothetical protein HYV97_08670 [Bdellovibrio sp.]|nr:hypothetical protein [Bdellovibrio sp.]